MKQFWLFFLLFVVACNRSPQASNSEVQVAESAVSTHTAIPAPTQTVTPLPTNTPTITPAPANTATNTPLPPTPTPTPTPKPVTHANIGWEGAGTESRDPFPDEMRIKSEIVESNQNNQMLNSITEEDIRVIWYEADDGTLFWYPYFTINNERVNNDLYLYVYLLKTDSDGNLSPILSPKMLNVTALERLGVVQNITDIQLLWQDHANKPVLAIEKNGVQIWYPDELQQNLVSYDQNLTAIGIPETPESAENFVAVLFAYYPQDVYLFRYDEAATATAGIGQPNYGPIYKLVNNHWQAVDPPEFIGGGLSQIAYIGYGAEGNGHLYIEEMTNYQTDIQIISNVHTPLAPAAIVYDAAASDMYSYDYYYVMASPVWAPDGRRIAFIAEENGTPFLAVYDLDAETWQSLVQTPANPELFIAPIWSPDGDWLVYGHRNAGAINPTLRTVSYPGGVGYYIDQGWNPQWVGDDGELLLNYEKSPGELFMASPDGFNIEPLPPFHYFRSSEHLYHRPIAYVPRQNAYLIYRTLEEDEIDKLLYVPLDGSEAILIAELPTENGIYGYSGFMFSPDGRWLFASRWNSQDLENNVYIQNLETQESWVHDSTWYSVAGWTPDSRGIIHQRGLVVPVVSDVVTGDFVYYIQVLPLRIARYFGENTGYLNWPIQP